MSSKSYLLIGGPVDGQRRPILNEHPRYRILEKPPLPQLLAGDDNAVTISVIDHVYTRRELTGGLCVYAHTSIPSHEILPRLLRGYSPDAL
jgi:hypothetical protein